MSPATRFDRFVEGDSAALTPREQRGFALFTGAGGCVACHAGFAFTDSRAHQLGASDADLGRAAVSGLASDAHAFRTPSLRELTYTAPYLHDGAAATLDDALRAHGGEAAAGVAALGGEDSAAVLGFLRTLSSEAAPVAAPPLDAAGEIVSHAAE